MNGENYCPITLNEILPKNILTITTNNVTRTFDIKAFSQYIHISKSNLHPITREPLDQAILNEIETRSKITIKYHERCVGLTFKLIDTITLNKYVNTIFDLINHPNIELLTKQPSILINQQSAYQYDLENTIDTLSNENQIIVWYKSYLEHGSHIIKRRDLFFQKLVKSKYVDEYKSHIPTKYFSEPPPIAAIGLQDFKKLKHALKKFRAIGTQDDLITLSCEIQNLRITYEEYLTAEKFVEENTPYSNKILHIMACLIVDKWNINARGCECYHYAGRYDGPNFAIYIF
jgi:hypothetical protein